VLEAVMIAPSSQTLSQIWSHTGAKQLMLDMSLHWQERLWRLQSSCVSSLIRMNPEDYMRTC